MRTRYVYSEFYWIVALRLAFSDSKQVFELDHALQVFVIDVVDGSVGDGDDSSLLHLKAKIYPKFLYFVGVHQSI